MNKPKTPKAQAVYTPSDMPGGYLPTAQLDRANAFASMRLALEAALKGDRNVVAAAVREAVADFAPEFNSHAVALAEAASRAEAQGRLRDLESVVTEKIRFFASAESGTLMTAKKHRDEAQIHATALLEINVAAAEKFRVRTTNY